MDAEVKRTVLPPLQNGQESFPPNTVQYPYPLQDQGYQQAPSPYYGPPPPIVQQPYPQSYINGSSFGVQPGGFVGPPGLEYLTMVDQLLIKQKMEIFEAFTGFESSNKYKVLNSLGQEVFFAKEDTDCCTRQFCGPGRPFEMNLLDIQSREVLHLVRPLRCQSCFYPCCLQELEVGDNGFPIKPELYFNNYFTRFIHLPEPS